MPRYRWDLSTPAATLSAILDQGAGTEGRTLVAFVDDDEEVRAVRSFRTPTPYRGDDVVWADEALEPLSATLRGIAEEIAPATLPG